MTVVLDGTDPAELAVDVPAVPPTAGWLPRAGAFAIDVIIPAGVVAVALLILFATNKPSWLFWICLGVIAVVVLAMMVNRLLLPGITGWTVGRSVSGITVVDRTGSPVSPWRLALREMAHLLDTVSLFVGWLWPLWDSRGRTFADMLSRTEVRPVTAEAPERRRLVGGIIATGAVIALVVAGLGFEEIYRTQKAVDRSRSELSEQGPKIVVEMLSYEVATLKDDFARAQSLAADNYRPQLIAQQQAVEKAGPVDNDYWSTNGAVLAASRNDGQMLILLQGQRGAAPKQRLITATVRVKFHRSDAGQWQVSDLTVLARPNNGGPNNGGPTNGGPNNGGPTNGGPTNAAPPKNGSPPNTPPPNPAPPNPAPPKNTPPTNPAPQNPAPPNPAPPNPAPPNPVPSNPAPPKNTGQGR